MSRTLCTFPGRYGDLLWALPTVRAIAAMTGDPVDLLIAGEFASLLPLLQQQPYLARCAAKPTWALSEGWDPQLRPEDTVPYDRVLHLGYRRWPELPLPVEINQTVRVELELPPLDLTRPWITATPSPVDFTPCRLTLGFTDCWFELKVGLLKLLQDLHQPKKYGYFCAAPGSRWTTEQPYTAVDWLDAAGKIAASDVFFGDCAALHVLAVGLGVPAVVVEPMEARWNPIFYPLGMDGPEVTVVRGLDGKPSFDARHTAEALEKALAGAASAT